MDARWVVAGLLLGAGLLVGCSSEDDAPSTVPSATETATATESAAPAPTAAPSTPGVIAAEEAVTVATQYYETINAIAAEGGGYERLDALVDGSCEACIRQADRLRSVTANGQRVVGGQIEIVETRVDSVAGNTALVRVATRSSAATVVDGAGTTVDTLPEGRLGDRVVTVALLPPGARVVAVQSLGDRP